MKVRIVVDMQNDFVDGALGTKEAEAIVPAVARRTAEAADRGEKLIFTRDTHEMNYLQTQEGRRLPVEHCIRGTAGWEIIPALRELSGRPDSEIIDKPGFGSVALGERLRELDAREKIESITLCGLCTDICVISNALLVKAALPETPVRVEASCCAGVTPASHETALAAMRMCQIDVV